MYPTTWRPGTYVTVSGKVSWGDYAPRGARLRIYIYYVIYGWGSRTIVDETHDVEGYRYWTVYRGFRAPDLPVSPGRYRGLVVFNAFLTW